MMFRFVKKIIAMEIAELICMTQQYTQAMSEEDKKDVKFGFALPDRSIID